MGYKKRYYRYWQHVRISPADFYTRWNNYGNGRKVTLRVRRAKIEDTCDSHAQKDEGNQHVPETYKDNNLGLESNKSYSEGTKELGDIQSVRFDMGCPNPSFD